MVSLPPVLKRFLAFSVLLPGLLLSLYGLHVLHDAYTRNCPEKDVLSWDANLRTVIVFDQIRDWQRGEIVSFLQPYFHAPTWPMLRSTASLLLFLSAKRPSEHDIYITVFTFALLILALAATLLYRLRPLQAGLAFFCLVSLLLHSREIPAYIFSSMLEVQGMFFTLASVIITLRLVSGQARPFSLPFFIICLIAFQGLVHTKYPYGLLFFPALLLSCIHSDRHSYVSFARFLFGEAGRSGYFFLVFVGGMAVAFLMLPGLKIRANLAALGSILTLIYFQFLYRKATVKRSVPASFPYAYHAGILPFVIWMAIHPDRITGLIDSREHTQSEHEFFSVRLFSEIFDHPVLWIAILLAGMAGLIFRHPDRKLLVSAAITCIVPFLILEIATSNKQLRHIYHLIPAVAYLCMLFLYGHPAWPMRVLGAGLPLLSLGILFVPGGLFSGSYIEKRIYCFTGIERGLYDPVREVVDHLPGADTTLLNAFAHPAAPLPGRAMTTELELLSRQRARRNGVRLYSATENRSCENAEIPTVAYVSDQCKGSAYDPLASAWMETFCPGMRVATKTQLNEHFCLTLFSSK
ncbi:MAG: hypothetical protein HS115_17525 [Spirochaetales bacterium]|nr:hypothetical protein [Spirochaetales bacterium]